MGEEQEDHERYLDTGEGIDEEIDPDLIAGYKCRLCGGNVCKDEAFARVGLTCECLECSCRATTGGKNAN